MGLIGNLFHILHFIMILLFHQCILIVSYRALDWHVVKINWFMFCNPVGAVVSESYHMITDMNVPQCIS